MSFSREISKSFLDLSQPLNKGHDVIVAIYKLIHNCKKEDPALFESYSARLERAIKHCSTKDDFLTLFDIAFSTISPLSTDFRTKSHQQCIALVFYISEWLWSQEKFTSDDKQSLFISVVEKMDRLLCEKFKMHDREKWYTFVVAENMKSSSASESEGPSFVAGVLLTFLLMKIF